MTTATQSKRSHKKKASPIETAMKPDTQPAPPEVIVHEKKVINCQYNFTEAEKIANGVEIGTITADIIGLEEQSKSVAKDYKGRLDMMEMKRQALALKLTRGYEFREIEALVTFRPKDGKKDFRHPFTMEIIRVEDMTQADFQMELMAKRDMESKKKEAAKKADEKKSSEAGSTNVGEAMMRAIFEAAAQQRRVEIDLDHEGETGGVNVVIRAFKKAATEMAEWPKKIATELCDIATIKGELEGTGAAIEVLRPFVVQN
jgi:hypothetical protein